MKTTKTQIESDTCEGTYLIGSVITVAFVWGGSIDMSSCSNSDFSRAPMVFRMTEQVCQLGREGHVRCQSKMDGWEGGCDNE